MERLKKTFKSNTGNTSLLSKQSFANDVLSGLVPSRLTEVHMDNILFMNFIILINILFIKIIVGKISNDNFL